eukprot:Blabericola_migrator_1__8926@NODE_472_length_8212_cov_225_024800_g368_i0_p2_GENE_NODE_472_length_8212_cov_225_024800_g368_i0NODE_472_length_8212_cov_225_024800_g368_i0_p2_ORF_typecomplete_len294_score49_14Ank_2/PF12796_7/7_7e02Ank_2/PF12796_7/0_00021Ank_2/PF12796_7/5e11Ank_4/PF13637_6/1_3e03Ank_4/PF13637_6/1_5e05Ank_4/PF13637_6/1_8e09Ank_5/PF13857_6/1_5e03Ank_5/PF13857_6/2_5e05Ank_5/PF13857_6/1_1e07Ank_5/PF13857_6/0_077Ank/PF00023_30/0_00067Ank/PF00023_30/0_21Ank/PF00023_30/16Ank_3/PF13606_6/8_6
MMTDSADEKDIDKLHKLCRDKHTTVADLLEIIEAQYPRLLANVQKAINKKKRKRSEALAEVETIEAPWLRVSKQAKLLPEETPESAGSIGPTVVKFEEALRPYDLFTIEKDEAATSSLRAKLRNWIGQRDKLGRTALHLAAWSGNVDAMKLLTLSDSDGIPLIDIHIAAQDGAQPIHFAASGGHLEAVKLCVRLGGRVNAATSKGSKTPLEFAQKKGHEDVIAYLISKQGRTKERPRKGQVEKTQGVPSDVEDSLDEHRDQNSDSLPRVAESSSEEQSPDVRPATDEVTHSVE